jgi:hypothetical protein
LRGAFGGAWCFAITTLAGGTVAEGSPEGATDDDTTGPATGRVVGPPTGSTDCTAAVGSSTTDPATDCIIGPPKGSIDCTAAVGSSTADPATDCTIPDVAKGGTAGRTTGDAGPTGPAGSPVDAVTPGPACSGPP